MRPASSFLFIQLSNARVSGQAERAAGGGKLAVTACLQVRLERSGRDKTVIVEM